MRSRPSEAEIRAERERRRAAPRCPACLAAAPLPRESVCEIARCPGVFVSLDAIELRTKTAALEADEPRTIAHG
jgi:hypothetical protein